WSKLKHPNVLELLGIALFKDHLAMLSPWMENGTLTSYLSANPEADTWTLCFQIAEGLAYIHQQGMVHSVHGNLKGANIYVSDEGVVKLGYFCHAISEYYLGFSSPSSDVNEWTPRWMAPELLAEREEGSADRSMPADVYALGMIQQEVVTGKVPYPEMRSDAGVIMRVIQGKYPQRPVEISSSTQHGDARWEMLLSCWKTNANSRPTAQEVRDTVSWRFISDLQYTMSNISFRSLDFLDHVI
ncbi:kinase-like protein, partial [Ceratobasidium sp. AG-I]